MRTVLAVIGAIAVGFTAFIGILFIIGMQRAGPLLKAAHEYTDEAVPAITAEWNGEELWSRAAPELMELLENGGLEQLMNAGSFQMGRLVNFNKSECALTAYELRTGTGERALAQCTGKAEYEKVIAGYTLNLIKRDNEWKILGFFVIAEKESGLPVMVSYRSRSPVEDKSIGVSLNNMMVGHASDAPLEAGAEVITRSKIQNFN